MSICASIREGIAQGGGQGGRNAVKFTTLIPTTRNDGTEFPPALLQRLTASLWRPFRGATEEGPVRGHWIDEDGTEFSDVCVKVSIECDHARLAEAIRAVKRLG